MPSNVVKGISKETGKSKDTVEKDWEEAKVAASKFYKKDDPAYWPTVTKITKAKSK